MTLLSLESLINTYTCFQSSIPAFLELILTNRKEFFENSKTFEVGTSDHHLLTLTLKRS